MHNDVARFTRNDVMFAVKCGEATHHKAKPPSLAKPTSFAVGKHHFDTQIPSNSLNSNDVFAIAKMMLCYA